MKAYKYKNFLLIASNFRNTSTGGLIWIEKLATYAKKIHKETKLLDLTEKKGFFRNNRLGVILYYSVLLLSKSNTFIFIDHSLHLRFCIPLMISCYFKKLSYGVICHHIFFKLRQNKFRRAIGSIGEQIFLKNARIVVVPSNYTSTDVMRLRVKKDKVYVINPTHAVKGCSIPRKKGRNKILFVGNVEPRKGVDTIIRALSLIKNLEYTFDVVGDCRKYRDYFAYLGKLVRDYDLSKRIIFHGRVSFEDLHRIYSEADIFVFSSRHEGYGMVLLEAMSFGLPVVATDIPTTRDLIKDSINGYLCPIDDEVCFSQKIHALLTDGNLWMKMAKRNFETSQNFQSWDKVVRLTFDCLRPYLFRD